MRKLLLIGLVVILTVFLVACGDGTAPVSSPTPVPVIEATPEPIAEPEPEVSPEPESDFISFYYRCIGISRR